MKLIPSTLAALGILFFFPLGIVLFPIAVAAANVWQKLGHALGVHAKLLSGGISQEHVRRAWNLLSWLWSDFLPAQWRAFRQGAGRLKYFLMAGVMILLAGNKSPKPIHRRGKAINT